MKLSGFFFFNVVSLIFALCVSDMNPLGFFFPLRALLMACLCSALSDLRLLEGFLLELLGVVELLGGSSTTSDVDGSGVVEFSEFVKFISRLNIHGNRDNEALECFRRFTNL